MTDIEFLKYPIGRFSMPENPNLQEAIAQIKKLPEYIQSAVSNLSEDQLDTPYRPGGWTVRQLVHHLADSHMNAFIRFKLALTEENPTIKPYDEAAWAKLPDSQLEIASSISILSSVHYKWVVLLDKMDDQDFSRTYFHPGSGQTQSLFEVTHMYAWHGQHHLAHIQHLALRENW
ncbi:putative metal-dependent hydrolase [Algoriphagus kandeliae]|uniref:Putative metal-dependent hydrolase n=1 Tax=Algoriphagus kandeliae TaxID=2562278 RepID=A0A4Y9QWY2_9BACT|nr:putative metal-dependent hydrolase [Algoriphagus kandeliae]TFV95713.1 putative metal-dependent hydrolase [Algoriphagus kandeliae]